ncbi:MAG: oligosaccharide flippase family protein [Oscillospiraceae bacterium]
MFKKLVNLYKNMGIAAKAAIWFVFCNLMQKGISTITVPMFTRLLTTAEYGTYSLYISWFNILTIVTSLNLYYGVFNNALNKIRDSKERDKYVSSMQGLTITLTAVLIIIYLPFQDFWSNLLGLSKLVLWLMIAELMVEPALQFWSGRQRFEYKYKTMVSVTLLKSALNPILGLILVILARDDKATARIVSVVAVEVVIAGTILVMQFIKGRVFYNRDNWKYALGFNIPLIPHYLSGTILSQSDRIMIQNIVGTAEVGIYSVAHSIGLLAQLFTNAINNSMTPWMYENLNQKDYKNIRKNVNYILLLLAGIIIALCFFVPELVKIFGSKEYYDAIYVVPPIAASVYFIFLYNVYAIPQMYFEKQKFMSVASIFAAVLNIVLNLIFISLFGYYAAGYTTLASYIVYSIGHYFFSKKVCLENIGSFEVFDSKTIFLISIGVVACSIAFIFLYRFTVLRYIIAGVLLIAAVSQYKKIIGIVKSIRRKTS